MEQAKGPLPEGVVTFLLTDIEGSTRLWDTDPEAMAVALATHERVIAEIVDGAGGWLLRERGEGDSTLSVFARVTDAVAVALDVQRGLRGKTWPHRLMLPTRIALHTGEPHMRNGEYYGGTLNRAARIRGLANGGEILCSRATHDLVIDAVPAGAHIDYLGEHELRGLRRRESVYAIWQPDVTAPVSPRFASSPQPDVRVRFGAPTDVFVGRRDELKRLEQECREPRLVTLVGAGGIGKTRLAIEAAVQLAPQFEQAWFVRLAGVAGGIDIAATLEAEIAPPAGGAVDLSSSTPEGAMARLVEALASERSLVVIDNCEHARLGVAMVVQELLAHCPPLTVLATSRERLNVPGERVVPVAPLAVPPAEAGDTRHFDAVRLLIERAPHLDTDPLPNDGEIDAMVEICRAVDGIPLGLELAAARLDSTSAADLAQRMAGHLELLHGDAPLEERHRTLDAMIEWSYELLSDDARTLLRRLAVFSGGFTLEAAERVCIDRSTDELPDAGSVHLALSELVSKSMVVFDREQSRYRLLVPIQLFARRNLDEDTTAGIFFQRHAEWIADLARVLSRAYLFGSPDALPQLSIEADNVDAALIWCNAADQELQLRIVGRLGFAWYSSDWRRGLQMARYATSRRREVSAAVWARALMSRGMLEQRRDLDASVQWFRECLELERHLGNRRDEAWALFWLGKGLFVSDSASCRELLQAAVESFRRLSDPLGLTWSLVNLSVTHLSREELADARAVCEEAAALARAHELGAPLGAALADLGTLRLREADIEGAREMLAEAADLQRSSGDRFNLLGTLTQLGLLELMDGRLDEADQFLCDALSYGLEQHDVWELSEALVGVAKLCLLRGDQSRARSYIAATGWDLASPLELGMSATSATAKALHEVNARLALLPAARGEGRRLGPEGAARRYLGDVDALKF